MMMLMLLTILKMLLVRAEMMMIKSGESTALECEEPGNIASGNTMSR